jgi:hypothetical protein
MTKALTHTDKQRASRGRHSRAHSLFNSRTCGLVLGAGAMQAASLKSITAKHLCTYTRATSFVRIRVRSAKKRKNAHPLPCCGAACKKSALAAESVGVEVALIPHIKARIGQYLTLKKHHILLNDLDRVLGVHHHPHPDHAYHCELSTTFALFTC